MISSLCNLIGEVSLDISLYFISEALTTLDRVDSAIGFSFPRDYHYMILYFSPMKTVYGKYYYVDRTSSQETASHSLRFTVLGE